MNFWERINVERVASSRLSREVWAFGFYESTLFLSEYRQESRKTTRHKFRVDAWWITKHDRSLGDGCRAYRTIERSLVPLPIGVAEQARGQLIGRIQVAVGHPNIAGKDGFGPWPGWSIV